MLQRLLLMVYNWSDWLAFINVGYDRLLLANNWHCSLLLVNAPVNIRRYWMRLENSRLLLANVLYEGFLLEDSWKNGFLLENIWYRRFLINRRYNWFFSNYWHNRFVFVNARYRWSLIIIRTGQYVTMKDVSAKFPLDAILVRGWQSLYVPSAQYEKNSQDNEGLHSVKKSFLILSVEENRMNDSWRLFCDLRIDGV